MDIQENKSTLNVVPRDREKIKKIGKTALILALITAAEFLMAFTMPRGIILYVLFMALTIWKAKYIIMQFMHLGDEVKPLIYSILVPIAFLFWLIIVLIKEGSDIFNMRWF
ncbi:Cytochrome C oxidase subunit IV [Algoriphagus locisalis]|uniref:Cytochrome C oxidase subunit IV n=1 Tax=Algoriphagus locisalis TaxID=305507 RepID=A0A1I6ZRS9_9BACT|nr:cytochrome C oxidase subunit IV family protein [Algoriphagus locisalis]SFT65423.1 Cytochrome C oxidase subunit IV [Algoriphagus locisalis]